MAKRFVFGVWHGGNGYGRSEPVFDIERFATIADATGALSSRARLGKDNPQSFDFVHKPHAMLCTPNADDGSSMDVYVVRAADESEALRLIFRADSVTPTRYSFHAATRSVVAA